MTIFNEQAQLFMAAAFCTLVGIACLYFALGLYAMALNRVLRLAGVHAALLGYILKNRKRWWVRMGSWFERNIEDRD